MEFAGNVYNIARWTDNVPYKSEVVIDTETTFVDGPHTPKLVLFQAYFDGDTAYYVKKCDLPAFFDKYKRATLIFHNASFDVEVLCSYFKDRNFFFEYFDQGRIKDTRILWQLYHLAVEGYVPHRSSLAFLMETIFQIELEKNADVRHTFDQFLSVNEDDIAKEHMEYALKDVIATHMLYKKLSLYVGEIGNAQQLSHDIQVAGHLALDRIYKRGIGFDLNRANEFKQKLEKRIDKIGDKLAIYGWVRGIPGSKEAYSRNIERLGICLPKTENGDVSSKEEDLLPYKEKHEFIRSYLDYHSLEKTKSFIDNIKTPRVHPRYQLLKNTGRTSCTGSKHGACNIQQLPRDGEIRSLFVPKEGHSFIITDYTAIELSALAQVTYSQFKESRMRDLINEGRDLHKYAASQIYKIDEKDVDKSQRLLAKILNFGLGANMSHKTFVDYAKGFGVDLSEDEALDLKTKWTRIFPEMKKYWDIGGEFGSTFTHSTLTGRIRAKASYTAYLNTGFQGLAADGAKIALFYLDKEGVDTVAFVHDEIVSEVPNENIDHCLEIQETIMVKGMRQVIPDVEVRVESQVANHYCK